MTYAITRPRKSGSLAPPVRPRQGAYACRRPFDNSQLIERFDKWLLICGKAANTRTSYIQTANQFGRFLIDTPLTTATKEDVRAFLGNLYSRALASTTIQLRLDALRAFFNFLQLGDKVHNSPPSYIERRKLPKHLPKPLSEDEIDRLLAAAPEPRDHAIIEVFYATGVRISELAALCIEDLNLPGRSLTVRNGKGGNDRVVMFGRPAGRSLREYLSGRVEGRIFPVSSRQIRRIVRDAALRAGLGRVHPHQLRHSFATHCLNHGMDIRFVQELLGHASLVATAKYLHVATANLQRTHAKFHPRG